MSEQLSPKAIIAESIIENFEAISSYVGRQSLRDMLDENKTLRTENVRLKEALEIAQELLCVPERNQDAGWEERRRQVDEALQPERGAK